MNNFKHKILTSYERQQFLELYKEKRNQNLLFRILCSSNLYFYTWVAGIFVFFCVNCNNYFNNILLNTVSFIFGILSLQILFVVSHMSAHALFLEYENHVPKNKRMSNSIVYYFAFYHHHHTEHDNWAPEMSYYNNIGYWNIIAAHWNTYSFVFSKSLLLVLLVGRYYNHMFYFFAGYELAVIILPYAHLWQHIKHNKFGIIVRSLFNILESIGIVANTHDHHYHHVYTIPTVYHDFSSSGIYAKLFDSVLNKIWDKCYYTSIIMNTYPHNYVRIFAAFVLVVLVTILSMFVYLSNH